MYLNKLTIFNIAKNFDKFTHLNFRLVCKKFNRIIGELEQMLLPFYGEEDQLAYSIYYDKSTLSKENYTIDGMILEGFCDHVYTIETPFYIKITEDIILYEFYSLLFGKPPIGDVVSSAVINLALDKKSIKFFKRVKNALSIESAKTLLPNCKFKLVAENDEHKLELATGIETIQIMVEQYFRIEYDLKEGWRTNR